MSGEVDGPLVFDAEPLLAHADDEPGAEAVEEYLDAVRDERMDGYASYVTFTEVRYVLTRKYDRDVAEEYLTWLIDVGIGTVPGVGVWPRAADFVLEYNPSLGDAYALAVADFLDGTLIAGADDDFDEVEAVPVERFREEPAT